MKSKALIALRNSADRADPDGRIRYFQVRRRSFQSPSKPVGNGFAEILLVLHTLIGSLPQDVVGFYPGQPTSILTTTTALPAYAKMMAIAAIPSVTRRCVNIIWMMLTQQ